MTLASITMFDRLEDTMAANKESAAWVQDSEVSKMPPETPEITAGEALRSWMRRAAAYQRKTNVMFKDERVSQ